MRTRISSRAIALILPCVAILYVATLLITPLRTEAYYIVYRWANGRTRIFWNTSFEYNKAKGESPDGTRSAIAAGAFQWVDVKTGAKFNVDENSFGGTSFQVYIDYMSGSAFHWMDPDVLAQGDLFWDSNGKVISAKQSSNMDWNWNDESDGSCVIDWGKKIADIRPITAHESGHWIVLGDNGGNTVAERDALMHADLRCKLFSNSDDDAGVKAIYGSP